MPYLNLDDNFAEHPKVDRLSHGAFRLHVAAMCYAAKHLTDGYVPAERVPRMIPGYRATHLGELLDATIWVPLGEDYQIHDYLDWNKSRQWWQTKRDQEAKRQREWRARKEEESRHD